MLHPSSSSGSPEPSYSMRICATRDPLPVSRSGESLCKSSQADFTSSGLVMSQCPPSCLCSHKSIAKSRAGLELLRLCCEPLRTVNLSYVYCGHIARQACYACNLLLRCFKSMACAHGLHACLDVLISNPLHQASHGPPAASVGRPTANSWVSAILFSPVPGIGFGLAWLSSLSFGGLFFNTRTPSPIRKAMAGFLHALPL